MINNKTKIFVLFIAISLVFAQSADARLSEREAKAVWDRVAKATELTKLPFTVKSDDKTPNAWVANGNSVTVTTGMLNLLDKQSELYGVLAHEAGHVKLGHYENTVKKATGLSLASLLLERLFGTSLGGSVASTAVNVGANLAYAGWSREQEVEADDYAVRLAYKNGEDPVGLYTAMQKLAAKGKSPEPSGFNSHPPDERRLFHIKNEILSLNSNIKFPTDSSKKSTKTSLETLKKEPAGKTVEPSVKKSEDMNKPKEGHYDIDAALERMKREAAAEREATAKAAEKKKTK